ncbi:MAG: hypothetical protein [Caudoviricetes sp.]|nr:MAG: hypothetical protein [Caudoviricetes sp.]
MSPFNKRKLKRFINRKLRKEKGNRHCYISFTTGSNYRHIYLKITYTDSNDDTSVCLYIKGAINRISEIIKHKTLSDCNFNMEDVHYE